MNVRTVMENSIFIAWDYLDRADELGNPEVARHWPGGQLQRQFYNQSIKGSGPDAPRRLERSLGFPVVD
jgi:hypothetical protein